MKRLPFSLRQITAKFFEPLIKHPFWTVSASVIIGIALYAGVDIGFAEVVRQNSYPIQMLSAELLTELGPDYVDESERYVEIIKRYTRHMEQRPLASILRVLLPKYSPEKRLESALRTLEKIAYDEEEASRAIWKAGVQINQFSKDAARFSRSPIEWFESEDVSGQLLKDLDNAFDVFHKQVDKLENAQTLEAAVEGCRATCIVSREAMLLLTLARLGYNNEEKKIERFLSDLKRSRDSAFLFARTAEDEGMQKIFYDRARIKDYKVEIVEAMLADDTDRLRKILATIIEEAIAEQNPP